jgi:hypothetical protein
MPRHPLPDRPRRTARAPVESETDPEPESEPESEPEPEPEPAPEFELGTREVFAVEHPAIIQNLDNGIKTFGKNNPFERVSPLAILRSRDLQQGTPNVLISRPQS